MEGGSEGVRVKERVERKRRKSEQGKEKEGERGREIE